MAEKIQEKIEEAKEAIKQGEPGQASQLSIAVAENTTYWRNILSTPAGKLIVSQFMLMIVAALTWATGLFDGTKKLADLGPIQVEIVNKSLAIKGTLEVPPAEPIPIPVPAKVINLVTFSEKIPPLDQAFWDGYRAKGSRVDHYSVTGPEMQLWGPAMAKLGVTAPCVLVLDAKNILGGGPMTDKATTGANIAKFEGKTP